LDRGYNVSFATHTHGKDWIPVRAAFVSLGQFPLTQSDLRKQLQKASRDSSTFHGLRGLFNDIYLPASQTMYKTLMPVIQQLQPVVMVVDIAALGALDAAAQAQVPLVVNNPTFPFSLESPPPWLPSWGTGMSITMSLWEKCLNVIFPRLLSVALTPPFITLNKQRWSVDLPTYRSQHEIFIEARILINTVFGFDHSRRMLPLTSMVGVIMPKSITNAVRDTMNGNVKDKSKQYKTKGAPPSNHNIEPLPPLITNWLHGGGSNKKQEYQGVVCVCLGHMAQLEPWQAKEIITGLTSSHFRVLWIIPNEQRHVLPKKIPPNFRIKSAKNMGENRLKVFNDPSVRAVISAGGLQSVQEALYFGKPVIVVPFLADQVDVAARVVDAGVGVQLSKMTLTAEEIQKNVLKLFGTIEVKTSRRGRFLVNFDAGNSSYAQNARKISSLLIQAGGLYRATNIIESSIKSSNAHLRTYSLEQPWHRVFQLDIFIMYSAVCALAAIFFFLILHGNYLLLDYILPSHWFCECDKKVYHCVNDCYACRCLSRCWRKKEKDKIN
jgi:hypothetical protein|tara:strand:+ start:234 stop:1886 length:1653 start_codon:yes stop_codon:yes gene_type:complete